MATRRCDVIIVGGKMGGLNPAAFEKIMDKYPAGSTKLVQGAGRGGARREKTSAQGIRVFNNSRTPKA